MYIDDAIKETNKMLDILPAYRDALRHQLYVKYMDNPTEFKELSQLLDTVYNITLENYQRIQSFK